MSLADFTRVRRLVGLTRGRSLAQLAARARSAPAALAAIVVLNGAALVILYQTEWGLVHGALALFAWGLLNFTFLAILRRPGVAAALSLAMLVLLVLLSRFKFDVLWMGLTFLDFL